jgi:phosphoenolpyruvate synthase/pyruvate phosphate dikinase
VAGHEDGLIAWLGEAADPAALGGKGASLDRLIRMGFRVPPGFGLTTRAFEAQRAAIATDAVRGAVDADAVDGERPRWVDRLATDPMVPSIARELAAALDRLAVELREAGVSEPRLAVRSSAIGEDGTVASYAGLHDTELDLAPADVSGAIARCWASLWSPAALAYRRRRGLPADDAAMAVVVQALVPADAAAVVFTRHPVTGREDQLVITAVRGLGDAMVAGTVTPDTYVIDKASRATLELERGEDPEGPALDAAGLAGIVDLALAVETGFGSSVDVEAAQAGGTWYLLQARPITAVALA